MGSYWHVDHILPISKFDLKNQNEIQICYHWSNLQPLETFENISKSNNIHLHTYFNNLVSLIFIKLEFFIKVIMFPNKI